MSCFHFSRVLPQLHVLTCDWLEWTFWYNWLVSSLFSVSAQSKSLLGESDRADKHETCLDTKNKNKNLLDKVNTCTTAKHYLIYEGRNIQFHYIFQPGLPEICLCQQGLTCTPMSNDNAVYRCLKIPDSPREYEEERHYPYWHARHYSLSL